MQTQLVLYFGILFYSILATVWLVVFDQGPITTAILLLGAPIAYWWYELQPARSFIAGITIIAVATALMFETVAHTSGLWLSVSATAFRVFGLFPLETLLFSVFLYVYIIFFHEFLVDDKKLYRAVFDRKRQQLLAVVVGVTVLVVGTVLLGGRVVIPYGFTLLLVALLIATATAAAAAHTNPQRVLHKALLTTVLVLPIMILLDAIAVLNVHTVFANPAQYLFSISVLGKLLPVEQVLYMVLAPIWVVTMYELYFDDAR